MNLHLYLGLLHKGERTLAESFRQVSSGHGAEPDIHFLCQSLAKQCDHHQELLLPLLCPLAALPLHAQYPNPTWEVEQAEHPHRLLLLLRPHLLLLDRLSRCTKPSMLSQVRKEKSLWSRVNWLK